MNRKILFKAKTTNKNNPNHEFNKKWTEGDLIRSGGKYYIHPTGNKVSVEGELGKIIIMHEIDPDTICQYTGLKDKNGKKIWENDIIKTSQYGVDNGDGRNFAGFDIFSISFSEGSFCLMNKWRRFNLRLHRDMEVIGNIFDNPELLEVE